MIESGDDVAADIGITECSRKCGRQPHRIQSRVDCEGDPGGYEAVLKAQRVGLLTLNDSGKAFCYSCLGRATVCMSIGHQFN